VDRLSSWIIEAAVARLPASRQERYHEEWFAHLEETPGLIAKLFHAIGAFFAAGKISTAILVARELAEGLEPARKSEIDYPKVSKARLRGYLEAIEAKFPIRFLGVIPPEAHLRDAAEPALQLLAEKKEGLSLLELAEAEVELSDQMKRPVAILLK